MSARRGVRTSRSLGDGAVPSTGPLRSPLRSTPMRAGCGCWNVRRRATALPTLSRPTHRREQDRRRRPNPPRRRRRSQPKPRGDGRSRSGPRSRSSSRLLARATLPANPGAAPGTSRSVACSPFSFGPAGRGYEGRRGLTCFTWNAAGSHVSRLGLPPALSTCALLYPSVPRARSLARRRSARTATSRLWPAPSRCGQRHASTARVIPPAPHPELHVKRSSPRSHLRTPRLLAILASPDEAATHST